MGPVIEWECLLGNSPNSQDPEHDSRLKKYMNGWKMDQETLKHWTFAHLNELRMTVKTG